MNNYLKIKEHLEKEVIYTEVTVETVNGQQVNKEKVQNLKKSFCDDNNLTASPELIEVLNRFYQSLIATITPDDKYYSLPSHEDLTTENYLATNTPSLGLKSATGIEAAIDEKHYQLLDKIIADSQKQAQNEEQKETSEAVAQLQAQDDSLRVKILELVANKQDQLTEEEASETDNPENLKKVLVKFEEGKTILTEIKQWLTAYQKLTTADKKILAQEFQIWNLVNRTKIKKGKKDQEDTIETQSKESKNKDKNQQELMYFGGFVVALIAIVALLKSDRR